LSRHLHWGAYYLYDGFDAYHYLNQGIFSSINLSAPWVEHPNLDHTAAWVGGNTWGGSDSESHDGATYDWIQAGQILGLTGPQGYTSTEEAYTEHDDYIAYKVRFFSQYTGEYVYEVQNAAAGDGHDGDAEYYAWVDNGGTWVVLDRSYQLDPTQHEMKAEVEGEYQSPTEDCPSFFTGTFGDDGNVQIYNDGNAWLNWTTSNFPATDEDQSTPWTVAINNAVYYWTAWS
jgi:hypothetical protein